MTHELNAQTGVFFLSTLVLFLSGVACGRCIQLNLFLRTLFFIFIVPVSIAITALLYIATLETGRPKEGLSTGVVYKVEHDWMDSIHQHAILLTEDRGTAYYRF